jgi:predicted transcriptional regulator
MEKLSERRTTSLSPTEAAALASLANREQRSESWLLRRAWLAYIARKAEHNNGGGTP